MSVSIPYTYIQCPCSGSTSVSHGAESGSPSPEELDDDHTFDPSAPRSNYSLYPLEYLLYCEDCHQIRCPRCIIEEVVTYYCQNCLFEVPTSNIKSEGNRFVSTLHARLRYKLMAADALAVVFNALSVLVRSP
jgi:dynactin 4